MDYKIPNHVAIIMDGNGRWAQKRGLKRTKGHQRGAKVLKKISEYVYDKKIKVLSVFAFSTENWKRDKEEVDYLMDLFIKVTGYNSKFFFLLKTGLEVQTNAYSQSAKRVIRKIRCNFNLTIAPPSVFSFDIFEIKLPNE